MSDQQQSTTQAFPSSDQQQSSTQAFVKKTAAQRKLYESGNELAAYAAKQINYHIMGYYPITPSTQIAENLDLSGARGEHNIRLIAAEENTVPPVSVTVLRRAADAYLMPPAPTVCSMP